MCLILTRQFFAPCDCTVAKSKSDFKLNSLIISKLLLIFLSFCHTLLLSAKQL